MVDGIITSWDGMELVWEHLFHKLCVDLNDQSILLTEPPLNHTSDRYRMVPIMFKRFGVPAVFLRLPSVLWLIRFESGYGASKVVLVDQGCAMRHAILKKKNALLVTEI